MVTTNVLMSQQHLCLIAFQKYGNLTIECLHGLTIHFPISCIIIFLPLAIMPIFSFISWPGRRRLLFPHLWAIDRATPTPSVYLCWHCSGEESLVKWSPETKSKSIQFKGRWDTWYVFHNFFHKEKNFMNSCWLLVNNFSFLEGSTLYGKNLFLRYKFFLLTANPYRQESEKKFIKGYLLCNDIQVS